jgi:hypothetical protein
MCKSMMIYKSCTTRFPAFKDSYGSRIHNPQITAVRSVNASDDLSHCAAFYYSLFTECFSQLISLVINL